MERWLRGIDMSGLPDPPETPQEAPEEVRPPGPEEVIELLRETLEYLEDHPDAWEQVAIVYRNRGDRPRRYGVVFPHPYPDETLLALLDAGKRIASDISFGVVGRQEAFSDDEGEEAGK